MKDHQNPQRPPGAGSLPFDPEIEAYLYSAYVDGELETDQVTRVEAYLAANPEALAEIERLRRLQEVTDAMIIKEAPPEVWEQFWNNIYNQAERGIGWFALVLGAVIVGGFGLYHFVLSVVETPQMPWYLKGGIFVLCFGILLLLVSVIRERIFVRRQTRYKNVIR
ncbi:MAG: hypothetical protein ABIF77_12340 [bacterium]